MRQRRHKITLWRAIIGLATIVALLSVGLVVSSRSGSTTERGYEKYRWQDTKYKGIRTKVVERSTDVYDSIIEYPITPNSTINTTISKKIDAYNDSFFQAIASRYPTEGRKFTQNTSYQIVRYSGGYLSLVITTVRDFGATLGVAAHDTAYWTFDIKTGKTITLHDIFASAPIDGPARVVLYAKQAIYAKLKRGHVAPDMTYANRTVTPERLNDFLVLDTNSLRFDFSPGEVAPVATGPLSVTLPTDNLQLYMQNNIAKKVFAVVALDAVPERDQASQSDTTPNCAIAKCIALTFDDGPGMYTSRVLDALKSRHAHASFMLIGQNIARYPQIVKREHDENHTIANHTWSHPSLTRLSDGAIQNEIEKTNQAVNKITGVQPTFLRPPNGAIGPNVVRALATVHMTGVLWSVDTRDWASQNSAVIYNRVVAGVKPDAIVILHDVHRPSVDAIPGIIDTLQKNGYTLVSLDELFGPNPAPGKIINGTL